MAINTTDIKTALLSCNGVLTSFAFSFKILADTDLKVYLIKTSDDTRTLLTITSDYSVSAANDDFTDGGNVVTVSTYASGYSILIVRDTENTQESDYTHGDDLPADTLEDDFDRRCMVAQEYEEQISRAIGFPVEDETTLDPELPPKADRLGKYLYFDGTNGEPTMVDILDPADAPAITDFAKTVLDDDTAGAALTTLGLSAFIKTLMDDADAAAAHKTLTSIKVVADADYTALDNDGYTDFLYDLVADDRTHTLPTAADNVGRDMFVKIRTNTSVINGIATWQLRGEGDWIYLICDGTGWHVKGHYETDLIFWDETDWSRAAPVQNTWYAITDFILALPTGGVWDVEIGCHFYIYDAAGSGWGEITVADGSAEEDDDIYTMQTLNPASGTAVFFMTKRFTRTLASNATLYVNARTTSADIDNLYSKGLNAHNYLRARRVA